MESCPSGKAPDFKILQSKYAAFILELRRDTIKKPAETRQALPLKKGFRAKFNALIGSVARVLSSAESGDQKKQDITTAEKVLAFAQDPDLADVGKNWEKHIELMRLARRKIAISSQEEVVADKELDVAIKSHSPSAGLKAHKKLVMASEEVARNTKALNDLSRQLFDMIHDVLKEDHS